MSATNLCVLRRSGDLRLGRHRTVRLLASHRRARFAEVAKPGATQVRKVPSVHACGYFSVMFGIVVSVGAFDDFFGNTEVVRDIESLRAALQRPTDRVPV